MIFLKTNLNKILLISVSVILVVLMALSSVGKDKAGIVSDTFGIVLSPMQKVVAYVSDCLSYGVDRGKYAAENNLLRQQLVTAQIRAADYDSLAAENAELRAMLELRRTSKDYTLTAADVISADAGNWTSTLRINKGLSSGIKKNDAVITQAGLVGYVSRVGRTWADVTTIIDTSSSVSVVISRIEEYGMLQGDVSVFDKNLCVMKYASVDSALTVGDILTTSGDGGIFPAGLQIGKITSITPNTNGISQDAVVEPFANFKDPDAVLVITGSQ